MVEHGGRALRENAVALRIGIGEEAEENFASVVNVWWPSARTLQARNGQVSRLLMNLPYSSRGRSVTTSTVALFLAIMFAGSTSRQQTFG